MKTKLALLASALVFVAGTTVYLQSVEGRLVYSQSVEKHSNKPFVVIFSRYRERTPEKSETIIQLVNSRGKSLIRRLSSDGREIEHFVPAFAPGDWQAWSDRAAYLRSAHVIRTEQILGLTAYVFRQDLGGQTGEWWYTAETGPIALKQIIETVGADTIVTEAINIEFREVSDKELEPQSSLVR
jgi:hypothetical protein